MFLIELYWLFDEDRFLVVGLVEVVLNWVGLLRLYECCLNLYSVVVFFIMLVVLCYCFVVMF